MTKKISLIEKAREALQKNRHKQEKKEGREEYSFRLLVNKDFKRFFKKKPDHVDIHDSMTATIYSDGLVFEGHRIPCYFEGVSGTWPSLVEGIKFSLATSDDSKIRVKNLKELGLILEAIDDGSISQLDLSKYRPKGMDKDIMILRLKASGYNLKPKAAAILEERD